MDETNQPDDSIEHPEALLAAYVDDSATPEERARAEAHLATCAICRDEVGLARNAYRALRALPEVQPHDAGGATAGVREGPAGVVDIRSRRRRRVMAGAGLATAAAVVAVFVAFLSSGGTKSGPSAASSQRSGGAPAIVGPEAAVPVPVSSADLAGLAHQLAAQQSEGRAAAPGGHASLTAAPTAAGGVYRSAFAPGNQVTCAASAIGLSDGAKQVYAQPVVLDGVPAWAVGYRVPGENGGPAHVVLVAVARTDCHVLYLARVSAPS